MMAAGGGLATPVLAGSLQPWSVPVLGMPFLTLTQPDSFWEVPPQDSHANDGWILFWQKALHEQDAKLRKLQRDYYGAVALLNGVRDDLKATQAALAAMGYDSIAAAKAAEAAMVAENKQFGNPLLDDAMGRPVQGLGNLTIDQLRKQWFAMKDEIDAVNDAWVSVIAAQSVVDFRQEQVDHIAEDINRAEAEKSKIKREIAGLKAGKTPFTAEGSGQNQSLAGLPPDADLLFRLQNMRWWSDMTGTHVKETDSRRGVSGEAGRIMAGADFRLTDRAIIGFGLGGARTDLDTIGNGRMTSSGLSLLARGAYAFRPDIWADASLAYGYDWVKNQFGGGGPHDSFGVSRIGFSAGLNAVRHLGPLWRAKGRIGWAGLWNSRKSSTNSLGTSQPGEKTAFSFISAEGRVTRLVQAGEIFAEGMLRYVMRDSSVGGFDDKPVDVKIGGGFRARLGGGVGLTAKAHTVLGRSKYRELGGSLRLVGDF